MAKQANIGVNNVAHKIKNIYIGVNNVARKVKKAYIGVNGVARLFFSAEWFIPTGLNISNVICAYQFKGVQSEAESLTDLTGHGHNLYKVNNPQWDTVRGFYFPLSRVFYSNQNLLNQLQASTSDPYNYYTCIIRAGNLLPFPNARVREASLSYADKFRRFLGYRVDGDGTTQFNNGTVLGRFGTNFKCPNEGVFANVMPQVDTRVNGVNYAVNNTSANTTHNSKYCLIGQGETWGGNDNSYGEIWFKDVTIQAAVFYNVALTDAQHLEMVQRMNEL